MSEEKCVTEWSGGGVQLLHLSSAPDSGSPETQPTDRHTDLWQQLGRRLVFVRSPHTGKTAAEVLAVSLFGELRVTPLS